MQITEWAACLIDERGFESWLVPVKQPSSIIDRLNNWHQIVNSYVNNVSVHRISLSTNGLPSAGCIRLRFPVWTLSDIEYVVVMGKILPPGTTQFIVQERMLNLYIPIYLLTGLADHTNEWEGNPPIFN
ncbi:hypothetical protein [Legionella drozanskii]|uniref:hypothetical protein n=1 Tax=Legionella drozanskii TaxID=96228 RepID=UPI0010417B8E|nr:hypothetical protein [Legionella drozanskii]